MKLSDGTQLEGFGKINIILGKNGSGKSILLRKMDKNLSARTACVRYVTPERGGNLTYEGSIETNRANSPTWEADVRRQNQWPQFRQSSAVEFRNLELLVLRSIENDQQIRQSMFKFNEVIVKINSFLDRIELKRSESSGFDLFLKGGEKIESAADLSSGESEFISLAIEIIYFSYLAKTDEYRRQDNWLLLDEPDVHLHPDLQDKLMRLLVSCMEDDIGSVAIATHSTTIVSSLCTANEDIRIGLKQLDSQHLKFQPADEIWKSILPMFGAHPLSNVFNEKPLLIVEGEDDERIWQTVVRHSQGKVMIYPCVAGDIQSMNKFERRADELMKSVYDDATAFSLRDRDNELGELGDEGLVVRFRLECRAAENLLVTDDVLDELGTNWQELQRQLEKWIEDNCSHTAYNEAVKFRDSGWNRKKCKLKNLRNIIMSLTESNKPWEVVVGRAIARLSRPHSTSRDSLKEYLGDRLVRELKLLGS